MRETSALNSEEAKLFTALRTDSEVLAAHQMTRSYIRTYDLGTAERGLGPLARGLLGLRDQARSSAVSLDLLGASLVPERFFHLATVFGFR